MPKKTPEQLAESRKKSNANLKHGNPATQFKPGRNAVENAKKANAKIAIKRKEERSFREILEMVWGSRPDLSPQVRDQLTRYGMDPDSDSITNAVVTAVALSQKANKGDTRAVEKVLEVLGQDPRTLLQQQALDLEREALQQGTTGYAALDDAFSKLGDGSDAP